jgi:hypothetical protein
MEEEMCVDETRCCREGQRDCRRGRQPGIRDKGHKPSLGIEPTDLCPAPSLRICRHR